MILFVGNSLLANIRDSWRGEKVMVILQIRGILIT